MLAIYTTDANGFSVTEEKFNNFVDALMAFDLARFSETVGRVELRDLSHTDEVGGALIKDHTTLWAMFR